MATAQIANHSMVPKEIFEHVREKGEGPNGFTLNCLVVVFSFHHNLQNDENRNVYEFLFGKDRFLA